MKPHTKILFVCLGNICRSPAAEGIFKQLLQKRGMEEQFEADSAGTYGGHAGELPDRRMRAHAARRGYNLLHKSRKIRPEDFDIFDLIIGMDDYNIDTLHSLAPTPEAAGKIHRMTDFCEHYPADHVPDPYYDGADGFENVLNILEDSCEGLLRELSK